jgi:hypothetical protein
MPQPFVQPCATFGSTKCVECQASISRPTLELAIADLLGGSTVEHRWRKSSRSAWDNCVEVAEEAPGVLVRDSKDPDGAVVAFGAADWRAFLAALGNGAFEG